MRPVIEASASVKVDVARDFTGWTLEQIEAFLAGCAEVLAAAQEPVPPPTPGAR